MHPGLHSQFALVRRAFTLIEVLIVMAIIALLLSILLPALSAGRQAARDLKCKANLRCVAFEFTPFADGSNPVHGESDALGNQRFFIEDFQESIYKIAEFWSSGEPERVPLDGTSTAMMCPSASTSRLERRAGFPCSSGGIGPMRNVSIGFNMRLHKRTQEVDGGLYLQSARLGPHILGFPDVPLLFDVDGAAATDSEQLPFYSAPAITNDKIVDAYENGDRWHPSKRHRNKLNVAFVGGHVLSSSDPVNEPWWRWNYQPDF